MNNCKSKQFSERDYSDYISIHKLKVNRDLEADQESIGSSEEVESPRSVVRVKKCPTKNVDVRLHIQIQRIREEDLYLGYDIVVHVNNKISNIESNVGVVLLPRPVLPASPLGAGERTETHEAH